MARRQIIGFAWIAVAAVSAAVTLIFRADPAQVVVTLALAALTAGLGAWMVMRDGDGWMRASVFAAVAWFTIYGILAILQVDDGNALVTDVGLAVIGAALGLLAWRSRASGATVDANPGFDVGGGH